MIQDIQRIGGLSKDGVFIYDQEAREFNYVNEEFASVFNISKSQVLRQPGLLLPLIHTEDADYLRHVHQQLQRDHRIQDVEFRLHGTGKPLRHVRCSAFLLDEQFLTGFVTDITKEKEHEEYIMNYGAKKDTLLDMMTHNLSGPLHLTQNIIRWMQETYKDKIPGEISAQLHYIQSNTQECVDIVNDFLRKEHMESERIYVRKTRFDLLERIMATLDKLVATNKNKKFSVITDLQSLNISTDSVKFFQAIHNLVSNAIKFTPDGGEIDILIEEEKETFKVCVRDNGIGIPESMQKDIFSKNNSSRRNGLNNERSSGLGLHIVKMLVDLMGGTVHFESKESGGSRFCIQLPKD